METCGFLLVDARLESPVIHRGQMFQDGANSFTRLFAIISVAQVDADSELSIVELHLGSLPAIRRENGRRFEFV